MRVFSFSNNLEQETIGQTEVQEILLSIITTNRRQLQFFISLR